MTPRCPGSHPKGALANPRAGEGHRAAACGHRLRPPSEGWRPHRGPARHPQCTPRPRDRGPRLARRLPRPRPPGAPSPAARGAPPRDASRSCPRAPRPRAPLTATTGPLSAPPLSCRRGDTGHPTPDTGPLAAEPAWRRSAGPPPAGRPRAGRPSRLPPARDRAALAVGRRERGRLHRRAAETQAEGLPPGPLPDPQPARTCGRRRVPPCSPRAGRGPAGRPSRLGPGAGSPSQLRRRSLCSSVSELTFFLLLTLSQLSNSSRALVRKGTAL